MRFVTASVFLIALSALIACQAAAPGPMRASDPPADGPVELTSRTPASSAPKTDEHGHIDETPRVELADAKALFDSGEAVFIDTRSENSYKTEHIKGALNIPVESVERRIGEIPKGKTIIAYCS